MNTPKHDQATPAKPSRTDKPVSDAIVHDEAQTERQAPNDASFGEPAGGE